MAEYDDAKKFFNRMIAFGVGCGVLMIGVAWYQHAQKADVTAMMTTVPPCAVGEVLVWDDSEGLVKCSRFAATVTMTRDVSDPRDTNASSVSVGSGGVRDFALPTKYEYADNIAAVKTLYHQPCFAGDVGATFRDVSVAVTTFAAAERIAADTIRYAREQCPKDHECKVIAVEVKYLESKK